MKKRNIDKLLYGAALSAGIFNVSAKENVKPNIIIFMVDQLRYDCLAYKNNDVKTPNIDELQKSGITFNNSYCVFPVCTPSRYSFLSGMYVHQHKAINNHSTLKTDFATFPRVLKNAGYNTVAIGKMHFAPTYLDVGYDRMILAEQNGPGRWDDDYHRDLMANNLVDFTDMIDQVNQYRSSASPEYWANFGAIPSCRPDSFYSTTWISNHSLHEISNWGVGGNLLHVSYIQPHHPFDVPSKWAELYYPDSLTILPGWISESLEHDLALHKGFFPNKDLTEEKLRKVMAHYYGSITQIDYELGRMIKMLKEKGIYDNTIIIFTSDHGEHLGYHHQLLKNGYPYESILRVPLIVKLDKNKHAGKTNNGMVQNIDIASSLLNYLKLDVPKSMVGQKSIFSSKVKNDFAFAHTGQMKISSMVKDEYKLILNEDGPSFLFNLKNDPYELTNLYDNPRYAKQLKKMKSAIYKWQRGELSPKDKYLNEDEKIIQQPNARHPKDGHRDAIIRYFDQKMKEYFKN